MFSEIVMVDFKRQMQVLFSTCSDVGVNTGFSMSLRMKRDFLYYGNYWNFYKRLQIWQVDPTWCFLHTNVKDIFSIVFKDLIFFLEIILVRISNILMLKAKLELWLSVPHRWNLSSDKFFYTDLHLELHFSPRKFTFSTRMYTYQSVEGNVLSWK